MASWEDDNIFEDHDENQQEFQSQTHSLSRLATCTSSSTLDYVNFDNIDDDNHGTLSTMFSRLSVESFDVGGDADEESCDGIYGPDGQESSLRGCLFLDSDDDKEPPISSWYSLPASPVQVQRCQNDDLSNQYLSDNNFGTLSKRKKSMLRRKKWEDRKTSKLYMNDDGDENSVEMKMNDSGESEGGLRVITKPKGGQKTLCMDMEEVKACRDLGFELEHQQMFDMTTTSSRLSTLSASTLDTTTTNSGCSSPISNRCISSPGDDPKDVKARLKLWAQAVALASSSSWKHLTS